MVQSKNLMLLVVLLLWVVLVMRVLVRNVLIGHVNLVILCHSRRSLGRLISLHVRTEVSGCTHPS